MGLLMGREGWRREVGEISVQSKVILYGEMWKDIYPNFFQPFLEILLEGALTMEAGSLFHYLTITCIMKVKPCEKCCAVACVLSV